MARFEWSRTLKRQVGIRSQFRRNGARVTTTRFLPTLDAMEDRTLLSTFTVTSNVDSGPGSLRAFIASAPSGSTIEFAKSVHNITLTGGELDLSTSLDIEGPGASALMINGDNASRVFSISSGAVVAVSGLTIADGLAATATPVPSVSIPLVSLGGGILNDGGTVTVSDVSFANNAAIGVSPTLTSSGGAIANLGSGASLTIDDTAFLNNQALGAVSVGGAVANLFGANLAIAQSTFDGNVADGAVVAAGGAIANYGSSTMTVVQSNFLSNQVVAELGASSVNIFQGHALGGAILNSAGGQLTVSQSTLSGNDALGGDGSGSFPDGGEGDGGAVANSDVSAFSPIADATLTVVDDTFLDNVAGGGAGADAASGTGATGGNGVGGAMVNISADLNVTQCSFADNGATGGAGGRGGSGGDGGAGGLGRGGAIQNTFAVPIAQQLEVTDSAFVDNDASGGAGGTAGSGGAGGPGGGAEGGAIRFLFGALTVTNSMLAANQATGGAGGAGAGGLGGVGGDASGGGLNIGDNGFASIATVSITAIADNQAIGGAGGSQNDGGNGSGGGLSILAGSSAAIDGTWIAFNAALGGVAGKGGTSGEGIGGGLYIDTGADVTLSKSTEVVFNYASTNDDNIFGTYTIS
jgi:hypothetical protein